jgi:protein-S-isoprenylcysteine O-methyltransferase Ste14
MLVNGLLSRRSGIAAEMAMTAKQNRLGVGPKWALPTTVYFVVAVIAHFAAYPRFVIAQVSFAACAVVGALLVAAGACMYAAAFVSLRRGLGAGILVTHGLYAIMRHPLYASSIFLIIPGVAMAFRSWLLLPMPLVAYVALRIFLPAEDEDLRERYGNRFVRYRETTNSLFPALPRWWCADRSARKRKE